tara:strand:+ start:398 stop:1210 length:813 start_codon:yes stop_codon:yes gene_type:complete
MPPHQKVQQTPRPLAQQERHELATQGQRKRRMWELVLKEHKRARTENGDRAKMKSLPKTKRVTTKMITVTAKLMRHSRKKEEIASLVKVSVEQKVHGHVMLMATSFAMPLHPTQKQKSAMAKMTTVMALSMRETTTETPSKLRAMTCQKVDVRKMEREDLIVQVSAQVEPKYATKVAGVSVSTPSTQESSPTVMKIFATRKTTTAMALSMKDANAETESQDNVAPIREFVKKEHKSAGEVSGVIVTAQWLQQPSSAITKTMIVMAESMKT